MTPVRLMGVLAAAVVALGSCASTSSPRFAPAGSGAAFTADSQFMSANPDWGPAVQIARFRAGVVHLGVEAVEAAIPYGETTVAFVFDGFAPGQPVEIAMDVDFDFFMQNGFIYLSYLPGRHPATEGTYPRPHIADGRRHEWIDSVGRFAGEPWPDATDGWQTIREIIEAGTDGCVTLIMMVNHYTETPPVIYQYFTSPTARAAG